MCFNGTREQAKSTCFYTCKYCSKVPANVKHVVPIMYATQKMVEQRRSKAQDVGTAKGKLKFHTNVLTNMYTKSTEYHDTQAAGKLLGIESEYKANARFWCFESGSSRSRRLRRSVTRASFIHFSRAIDEIPGIVVHSARCRI